MGGVVKAVEGGWGMFGMPSIVSREVYVFAPPELERWLSGSWWNVVDGFGER